MIAIAVDDEALMLGALVAAIEASPDITEVTSFSDCEQALAFVKNHPADVAFLDINMRGMGGLALAEKIIASCPNCMKNKKDQTVQSAQEQVNTKKQELEQKVQTTIETKKLEQEQKIEEAKQELKNKFQEKIKLPTNLLVPSQI